MFAEKNINEVLERLADDPKDFTLIVELLENDSETADENLITALKNLGKETDENFEEILLIV